MSSHYNPDISNALQKQGTAELPANLASAAIAKLRASQPLEDGEELRLKMTWPAIRNTQFKTMVAEELGYEKS